MLTKYTCHEYIGTSTLEANITTCHFHGTLSTCLQNTTIFSVFIHKLHNNSEKEQLQGTNMIYYNYLVAMLLRMQIMAEFCTGMQTPYNMNTPVNRLI